MADDRVQTERDWAGITILLSDRRLLDEIQGSMDPAPTQRNLLGWIIRQEHARRFPAAAGVAMGGAAGGTTTEETTQP